MSCILLFCIAGWHRISGEGCPPRRQRPQPAQYSGHYHCELLFFLSPGYVLICLLKCLCQFDLFIHYLHAPETKLMYFVFAVICLFKAASFRLCFSLLKIHNCHPFHTLRLMLFGTDCAVMNSNHICNV